MSKKQTMQEAGYRHIKTLNNGLHALESLSERGTVEIWAANKNHASYGIKYKNTHLEFCSTMSKKDARATLKA